MSMAYRNRVLDAKNAIIIIIGTRMTETANTNRASPNIASKGAKARVPQKMEYNIANNGPTHRSSLGTSII
ncbi:MAG: hypothetical protein ACFFEL_12675 [Candidatus Thorarchaeota archaeon]